MVPRLIVFFSGVSFVFSFAYALMSWLLADYGSVIFGVVCCVIFVAIAMGSPEGEERWIR